MLSGLHAPSSSVPLADLLVLELGDGRSSSTRTRGAWKDLGQVPRQRPLPAGEGTDVGRPGT